jgi:uncharacterized membrane protein HdeD (DUF308 family)
MIRLAMLLVGARALRRKWPVITVLGLLWMALGLAIMADAADGVTLVATEAFAILLLFEGFGALALFAVAPRRRGYSVLIKACALLILGCMILDFPIDCAVHNSILFGIAFLIDGCARIVTAAVVRFPKWQIIAAGGLVEIGLAALAFSSWPVSYDHTVPFCIGVALLLSGWTVSRLGLMARRLTDNTSVLSLPMFEWRGWHKRIPLPTVQSSRPLRHATPLVVRVWTPVGSVVDPERRLLIDRYCAAVDGKGRISTGHAALELLPDLYISHYPRVEIEHSPEGFMGSLRATAENDVPGKFLPSYAFESGDWWCPADARVEFHTYDEDRLRAHWMAYRRDDTYNLTNRNCSVSVAVALEAALEGILDDGTAWRRFHRLVANPDFWITALLRARAESMTWTPGLLLDYASSLREIVQPHKNPWSRRLQAFWRLRRSAMTKRPA